MWDGEDRVQAEIQDDEERARQAFASDIRRAKNAQALWNASILALLLNILLFGLNLALMLRR